MANEKILQVVDLCKSFHKLDVLKHISVDFEKNEVVSIIGPSGGGKSTFLRCLNLLETPTSGQILFDGVDICAKGQSKHIDQHRQKMGMVFQQFNLFNNMNVMHNLTAAPTRIKGMDKEQAEAKALQLLGRVGLADRADAYPSQLSGGQTQRGAIARALANDPKILLCDEATSALDPQTTKAILRLLHHLNQTLGITIVVITHEMAVVKEICNRVAVMDHGKVVEEGTVFSVFATPKEPITRDFIKTTSNLQKIEELIADDSPVVALKPGERIVRLSYVERNPSEPLISLITQKFGITLNIIFADVEIVQNAPIGGTVAIFSGDSGQIDAALTYLKEKNVGVEVIRQ